jgi:hypothetical protein
LVFFLFHFTSGGTWIFVYSATPSKITIATDSGLYIGVYSSESTTRYCLSR